MSDTEIGRKMGIRVTEFFPVFSNARSAYVFVPAEWAVEKNHSVCCTLEIEFARAKNQMKCFMLNYTFQRENSHLIYAQLT